VVGKPIGAGTITEVIDCVLKAVVGLEWRPGAESRLNEQPADRDRKDNGPGPAHAGTGATHGYTSQRVSLAPGEARRDPGGAPIVLSDFATFKRLIHTR
jgi:hypothetical protein